MSKKKKRIKQERNRAKAEGKFTQEQVDAFERILLAAQPTETEKQGLRHYKLFGRKHARKLALDVYGVNLKQFSKSFQKECYDEYAFGMVYGDFGGFHSLMITKCAIFDGNWKNFITEKGEPKNESN
jgi:hypothetical protein